MKTADQLRLVILERRQRDETVRGPELEKFLQRLAAAAILRQPRERFLQGRLHRRLVPDFIEIAFVPVRLRLLKIRHLYQDQRRLRQKLRHRREALRELHPHDHPHCRRGHQRDHDHREQFLHRRSLALNRAADELPPLSTFPRASTISLHGNVRRFATHPRRVSGKRRHRRGRESARRMRRPTDLRLPFPLRQLAAPDPRSARPRPAARSHPTPRRIGRRGPDRSRPGSRRRRRNVAASR